MESCLLVVCNRVDTQKCHGMLQTRELCQYPMNVIATYDYLTSKWAFVTIVIGPGTEKQHCLVKWYLKVHKYLESPIKMFKRKF